MRQPTRSEISNNFNTPVMPQSQIRIKDQDTDDFLILPKNPQRRNIIIYFKDEVGSKSIWIRYDGEKRVKADYTALEIPSGVVWNMRQVLGSCSPNSIYIRRKSGDGVIFAHLTEIS